jgi:Ca2+-binding RTX toxin-like protein
MGLLSNLLGSTTVTVTNTGSAIPTVVAPLGDIGPNLLNADVSLGSIADLQANVLGPNGLVTVNGSLFQTAADGSLTPINVTIGTDGDDLINVQLGSGGAMAGAGNDTINGSSGNEVLSGGDGNDVISGGPGDDTLAGGAGDDNLNGGDGSDLIYGNQGADSVTGSSGNDIVFGGQGNDVISYVGFDGRNLIYGGLGDDQITGGAGNETIFGGQGIDAIDGRGGDDLIYGNQGGGTASSARSASTPSSVGREET